MSARNSVDPGCLHTVPVLARRMGVSERTVWRLIENGELAVHRIRRAVRVKEADLQRYLEHARGG
ncbi:MAG: helix-turn-helix domain-containing protein [Geminicoccaceae bacterium]